MFCAHCGSPVEAAHRFCAVCGNPTAAETEKDQGPAVQPAPAGVKRPFRRAPYIVSAVVAVSILAGVSVYFNRQPSYGPAQASALDLTLAPGVSVEILPSSRSLAGARFDAFDVSAEGSVIVSVSSVMYDLLSGGRLLDAAHQTRAFTFVGEALAMIDGFGDLGYYEDGAFKRVAQPLIRTPRLVASSDRTRLFMFCDTQCGMGEPALVAIGEGGAQEPMTSSPDGITAVAGDAYQMLFAVHDVLFQIVTPGHPSLLLALPDEKDAIVGLALAGTATYFSTARAIYALDDGVAVPVVLGLGGDLRVIDGALLVLDSRQGRIYRVALGSGRAP